MPSLGSLTRPHLVEATFGYDGETVTIRYDRNRMTTSLLSEVQMSEDPSAIAVMFAEVIVGWDVTENDGSPFLPNIDNFARLPLGVLKAISEAIRDNPSSEEGKDSSGLSSIPPGDYTAPPGTSPNGPAASSSPALSG